MQITQDDMRRQRRLSRLLYVDVGQVDVKSNRPSYGKVRSIDGVLIDLSSVHCRAYQAQAVL
jgi:hypothetical protein